MSVFIVTQCISAAFAHPVVLEQITPPHQKKSKKGVLRGGIPLHDFDTYFKN